MRRASIIFAALLGGCTTSTSPTPPTEVCTQTSERRVVTADFLNRSLSVFDESRLVDPACDAASAMVARIDLSAHPPGPLEVELTAGGDRAIVSSAPGFLAGNIIDESEIEEGHALLVVDLGSGQVDHVITLPHAPMGIAISPDDRFVLTANYGTSDEIGDTLSVIDLEAGTLIDTHTVGSRPEQVALSADGSTGLINAAEEDTVRSMTVDGANIVMSDPIAVGADPSDVALPSTSTALVTSSLGFSFSVIDTTDPGAPSVIAEHPTPSGIPYGVAHIPGTNEALVTTFLSTVTLVHLDLSAEPPAVLQEIAIEGSTFTLGAAVTSDGGHAFVPQPNDQRLSIVDLASGEAHFHQWLADTGPTYVAVQPDPAIDP